MRLKKILWVGFLLFACTSSVRAQWVPVVAKVRQTHETWKDGKLDKVERKEGVFYRASDGSTLKYWTQVDGDESRGGAGEMTDNSNLIHYSLNMRTKNAHEIDRFHEKLKPGDITPASMKPKPGGSGSRKPYLSSGAGICAVARRPSGTYRRELRIH